jgi:hypothetical protein
MTARNRPGRLASSVINFLPTAAAVRRLSQLGGVSAVIELVELLSQTLAAMVPVHALYRGGRIAEQLGDVVDRGAGLEQVSGAGELRAPVALTVEDGSNDGRSPAAPLSVWR